ncbi:ClpXP protease specificity-enhancing factor [Alkalimonas sp. MEB108]|uniref:ClpXP protease specificity-enhancing factor n=1 Tax=Alkalimonas cellulosilytica TaxID=3058395 RepID=A0ABU7J5Q3_9GAMM|nr:ClpXP protease specificity-enhancing factor [Alkalimonas sp. MEB108]MEE2001838.1 ClpXP protease specificity-enhancing factor [Alkalimonas sp. MEB108]
MTPNRPYLLRAFYEWIVDNDCTPYLVVDATFPQTKVPQQFVQNGQIVLNLAPSAVAQMQMGNEVISCSARFGGHPFALYIPVKAVLAIYAKENGAGTVFTLDEDEEFPDEQDTEPAPEASPVTTKKPAKGSHLKVIK